MNGTPFSFFPLPSDRSTVKPRQRGLTMVMDCGIPLGAQEDWLELNAPFVDLMKLIIGTARLYDESYLRKKVQLYKRYQVTPILGGLFLEYVLHAQGLVALGPYCDEAKRLGIDAIEVSDNLVPFTPEERRTIIRTAVDSGLHVHGEIGSKFVSSDGQDLIDQALEYLDAGVKIILVEGAELMRDSGPDLQLCKRLESALDIETIMFELGGPWLPGVTVWSIFAMKKFLIQHFGPDVNIANVMPEYLLETEATRTGLGAPVKRPEEVKAHSALRRVSTVP